MKSDIKDKQDIVLLVNSFYEKVRKDSTLAPIFNNKIPSDWGPHLDVMYRFWNAALFNVREYHGNPFLKHVTLPLKSEHFDRWITLFYETVDSMYEGSIAEEAKRRAMIMAHIFYDRMKIKAEVKPLPEI